MKIKITKKTKRILFLVLIALFLGVVIGLAAFGIKSLFGREKDGKTETEALTASTDSSDEKVGITYKNAVYGNSLTDDERCVYDAVYTAAVNLSDTTEVCDCSLEISRFEELVSFVRADNPQLFYVNFDELVLEVGDGKVYADMVYSVEKSKIPEMKSELENAIASVVSECNCNEMTTELEKEIALHDALIQKCVNSSSGDLINNTAYGALVLNEAYCDGYAYAMKLLLERVGIEAYVVYGTSDGVGHAWNMVNIDGDYYNLDVLWDDANLTFAENMCFHGYFNLSDEKISLDHIAQYRDILPIAEKDNDYYTSTGKKVQTVAQANEILKNELIDSINKGKYYLELLCEETSEDSVITGCLSDCITEIYGDSANSPIYEYFTVYHASANSNAVTVQFYYK